MQKMFSQYLFKSYLEPTEKIIEVCHRHPFILIPAILRITFFGILIPLFLYVLFPDFILFYLIWFAVTVVRFIYVFMEWYHDAVLLTDVSLIRTGWFGFFNRTTTRLEYPMIEGLSYAIQGFRKTIFNYGDVNIGRAGGNGDIHLNDAINPAKVERKILGYQEKFVSTQNIQDSETLKSLLVQMIRHHTKNPPKK